jgi:hypothetical protein
MSFYGLYDGDTLVSVFEIDGTPEDPSLDLVALSGWTGWTDYNASIRTLSQAKAQRIAAMQVERDAAIHAGFTWDSSPFDCDDRAQIAITALYLRSTRAGFTATSFRLADNTWRTLDATAAGNLFDAMKAHIDAAFVAFASVEADILAATEIVDVDGMDWAP